VESSVTGAVDKVMRLGKKLQDPSRRADALAKVRAIVTKVKPDDVLAGTVAVAAAAQLLNAQLWTEAVAVLDDCPTKHPNDHEKERRAVLSFACRTYGKDLTGARAAMGELPAIEPGTIHHQVCRVAEGMLLVHENQPDDAIALLAQELTDPHSERTRRAVLARAYAARDERVEMGRCLAWLKDKHGESEIERVIALDGPASIHARAMLRGGAAPYRG